MRVRTPRLLVKVVSGKRNGDGDGIIRGRKNGWVLCINNTFCSSSTKAAVEEEEEVGSSSGRKINIMKKVVAHRLIQSSLSKKIVLGIKGETAQKLGRSFNCLVSRFSGMIRLKKKKKKKSGFRLRGKWKKIITRKSSVGAVNKRFERIRIRMGMGRKMMMRKEEEIELCKKRILMGEKCKPLNVSGSLHYDQNGVLLPELLLPCE